MRAAERSSSNVTSRAQCSRFSIAQTQTRTQTIDTSCRIEVQRKQVAVVGYIRVGAHRVCVVHCSSGDVDGMLAAHTSFTGAATAAVVSGLLMFALLPIAGLLAAV